MKYANLNNHPLVLPGPRGGSCYFRPGESRIGTWWSRHCGPSQLTSVADDYVVSKDFKDKRLKRVVVGPRVIAAARAPTPGWPRGSKKRKGPRKKVRPVLVLEHENSLATFRNAHRRQRAFIIGNGPSLDKTDLSKLRNELTFGCNMVAQCKGLKFVPDYFVFSDHRLFPHVYEHVNSWWQKSPGRARFFLRPDGTGIFSRTYEMLLRQLYDVRTYLLTLGRDGCFSIDIAENVTIGVTVTYAMLQLAYYMGCNPVYLIGCDATKKTHFAGDYYMGHEKAMRRRKDLVKISKPGWQMVFDYFALARRVFETDQRKVFNATIGGQLNVFERKNYKELF